MARSHQLNRRFTDAELQAMPGFERWYYEEYGGDDFNRDYYLKGMTLLRIWEQQRNVEQEKKIVYIQMTLF
jgi:hypothetical protein